MFDVSDKTARPSTKSYRCGSRI